MTKTPAAPAAHDRLRAFVTEIWWEDDAAERESERHVCAASTPAACEWVECWN